MFFEGSEKKVEIIIKDKHLNLLEIEECVWYDLVKACNASIISKISNSQCLGYLLSESSLFLWRDRLVMITCGDTGLINSIIYFVEKMGKENILSIIFQRKNEYFSQLQKSNFYGDIAKLKTYLNGTA